MVKPTQDINHLIAKKIGITVEDLKTTLSIISCVIDTEPDLLEVIKVWRMEQTIPVVCDWWGILVYTPMILYVDNTHYFLYEISDWGEDNQDSVDCLECYSSPIETIYPYNGCIVELLFENYYHIKNDNNDNHHFYD